MKATMGRIQADDVLEQCLAAMRTQGLTVEDCLQLHPALRAELEPLLRLAVRLPAARRLEPSAQFKAAAVQRLRQRVVGRSAPQPRPMGFRRFWAGGWVWPQRLNAVLAAVLVVVLIVGGWGTVAASAQSLPGDLLYPIKRADESLRLGLAPDEASRAQLRLDFSGRRIDEAIRLIHANRTDALDQVLADYNDQMQSALTSLQPSSPLTPSQQQALASRVATESQRQSQSLSSVRQAAPPAAQAKIDTALSSSQHAYRQATTLIQNPGRGGTLLPTPAPSVEPPTLTQTPTATPTWSPVPPSSATPRPILNTPVPTLTPSPLPTSTTSPDTATPTVRYPTGTPTRIPGSSVIGVGLLTRTPGVKLTATLGAILATIRAKDTETPRPILGTMLPPILATRLATRTTAPNSGTPPVSIIVVRTPTATP